MQCQTIIVRILCVEYRRMGSPDPPFVIYEKLFKSLMRERGLLRGGAVRDNLDWAQNKGKLFKISIRGGGG